MTLAAALKLLLLPSNQTIVERSEVAAYGQDSIQGA